VSPPPKISRRRYWLTRLLFLFFAFVLFLLSPLRDQIAKSIVVRELSSYLGEPVWIPGLKTTLWPPQVQIQGVQIGSKDQSFVQITQIDIDFQIQSGSPWIHSIDVQSPVLHLPFDEGGLIPFRNRVRGENPIIELPFEDLNVFDAVIVVKKEEITTRVSDLYLEYSNEKGSIRGVIDPIVVGEKTIHISPLSTEFLFVPGRFSLPDISLEVEGVSLRGNILLENGVEGTLSIWGRIPEIARGKKLHLEGELESTIQVSQNNEGLDIHMNGVIHDTELHRLLRSGERDFLPFSELQHKLRFYDGIVFIEELRTPFAGGKVFGKGLYNPILDQLTLGVKLEEVPLWQMGYDLRLSQNSWVSGTVDGTLNLEGSLRDVQFQGPIELMISELDVALGPIDKTSLLLEANDVSIVGLASITRANFSIDDGVLLSGENQAKLDYFVQWGAEPKTDVRLKFSNILLDSLRPFAGMNFVGQGGMDVHLWGKPKALQLTMSSDIYRFSLLGFGRVNRFLSQISSSDLKHWNFSDLKIWNGTTEIGGTLDIDFVDRSLISRLEVSQGRIEDLIPIFFDFTQFEGDASGWISMDGPFLDMKIQSEFLLKDTQIWGEPFSEGYFSMQMRQKFLTVDELSLREGKNELLMRGSMDEEKDLNFEIHSNQWNVSDITTLSNLNLPIDGKIQFHSLLKGKGIRPSGSIEFLDVSYNGIPLQSGNLDFSMETSNGFDLKGELPKAGISYVGNTQSLSIGDNYSINVDLDSFPAHIFYPKSRTGEKIQMETTGDIHIESYGGEFFMEAQLNSFQFRVRNLVLSLLKPTSISFQSNEVSLISTMRCLVL
jgi:hypothetical protein